MSQMADIQDLTTRWKGKYKWSEEEHVENYLEILGCLEWDAHWGDYPKDADGKTDWAQVEELDRKAARKSLGYK